MNSFRVYVDRGGKMPQLRRGRWHSKSHPFYVRYANNRPVGRHGPLSVLVQDVSKTKVWDYSVSQFVDAASVPEE